LEVNGKSILDYLIEDIDKIDGIDEHIIISNAKYASVFEEWAEKSSYKKPITVLNDGTLSNETRLGAVKDIEFAIDTLGIDEDILVIAGDNLLDFSLEKFVRFAQEKDTSAVMVNYESELEELRRCGVMVPDENMKIVSMEEKPQNPKSNWCVGPFYYYKKDDLKYIKQGIADGCAVDAPGSFVCYLCQKTDVYALEMPGDRFDIGGFESYDEVKKTYKGIIK
jgi:glucose-1-phosphate thymidylyltransferase